MSEAKPFVISKREVLSKKHAGDQSLDAHPSGFSSTYEAFVTRTVHKASSMSMSGHRAQ